MAEPAPLAAGYGAVVLDLDGVVYLGEEVVPAAPQALKAVRGLGVRVGFVTNNSWRPPAAVAGKLDRLGVEAATGEVLTSAQAAVRMLGGPEALRGTPVLVVGGEGLRGALAVGHLRLALAMRPGVDAYRQALQRLAGDPGPGPGAPDGG